MSGAAEAGIYATAKTATGRRWTSNDQGAAGQLRPHRPPSQKGDGSDEWSRRRIPPRKRRRTVEHQNHESPHPGRISIGPVEATLSLRCFLRARGMSRRAERASYRRGSTAPGTNSATLGVEGDGDLFACSPSPAKDELVFLLEGGDPRNWTPRYL